MFQQYVEQRHVPSLLLSGFMLLLTIVTVCYVGCMFKEKVDSITVNIAKR